MSDFLEDWDFALRSAREHGEMVWMRSFVTSVDHGVVLYPQTAKDLYDTEGWAWSGRTMHPAFMAPPMPKHDPERDQPMNITFHPRYWDVKQDERIVGSIDDMGDSREWRFYGWVLGVGGQWFLSFVDAKAWCEQQLAERDK